MSLPANVLSTIQLPAAFLPPINRDRGFLEDWELGGIDLNDTSQGLQVQAWHLTYSDPVFTVTPEDVGLPTPIFSAAGCNEVALAFDANMDYVLAYMQGGQAKLRWFDITKGMHVITDLEGGAYSPRLSLDDKRALQLKLGNPDVILAYFIGQTLYHRRQRDRYGILYPLLTGFPIPHDLHKIGMNAVNRFQFSYLIAEDAATKPTVTTPTSADVTETTATLGGNVTEDGGNTITERGTVWGLLANPDIVAQAANKNIVAGTTGVFTGPVTGLPIGTLIHFRAYATNSEGTSYSFDSVFTTVALDIVYVDATTLSSENTGTSTINIDSPAGVISGDLIVMIATTRNSTLSLPSGGTVWSEKESWSVGSGSVTTPPSSNDRCYVWSKVAGGSEPATYGVDVADDGVDGQTLICLAFRNASVLGDIFAGALQSSPSVIAQTNDTLITWNGTSFDAQDDTNTTAPAGMTLANKVYTEIADVGVAAAYQNLILAGATGDKLWGGDWGPDWNVSGSLLIR